jgi:4-amino-4-deoxy-L-arabinose transferase-like glycosyltransferase
MKKRAFDIQSVFLQKPVISILLISMLMMLPFLGIGDFYTKGEPREASLALSILQGRWVLPIGYADEIAYKPPLMHWLIAGFSLITGSVSEFTSRLPSALALIGMTVFTLLFLLRLKSTMEAVLASLIILTSFELHRYGLECRVDMTLAFFMAMAQILLFKWEEKGLKGFPVWAVIGLTCACLVKGPVGAVLPSLVFGVYLLLKGYGFWLSVWKNILIVLLPFGFLGGWYYLAYLQGGQHFLDLVFAENIGRFLGMSRDALGINYDLGHVGPFWYYIPAVFLGFMPWSLIALVAAFLFGFKAWFRKRQASERSLLKRWLPADNLMLYSVLVVVLYIVFYSIPSSKRSVYIMPIYPFAGFLLAQVFLWVEAAKPKTLRITLAIIQTFCLLLLLLAAFCNVFPEVLPRLFASDARTAYDVALIVSSFQHPTLIGAFFAVLLIIILVLTVDRKYQKSIRNTIFSIFIVYISMQLFLEGAVYPAFKDGHSVKSLAKELSGKYDLRHRGYVMNNLRYYRNLYGLSFYTGNCFKNFEKEQPEEGFLLLGRKVLPRVQEQYARKYIFTELECSNPFNELNDEIVVFQITKIKHR